MLQFQSMNEGRKRTRDTRDDDSDTDDERYFKKTRPWPFQYAHNDFEKYHLPPHLPLRPSFTPSPPRNVPNLEATTPAQSEYSEGNSPVSLAEEPDRDLFNSPRERPDIDMDMDMDDDFDIIGSQPPDSPFTLRPPKLDAQLFSQSPVNNTGRIPTPIHGTFYAPRNGQSRMGGLNGLGGLGYPSSGMAGGMSTNNGYLSVPELQPPVLQKQARVDQDRGRRMPSPISEDEDIPDTPTALTQSQLSRLSMTHSGDAMTTDMMEEEEDGNDIGPPPGPATSPTKGRKRSGAFTGKGRFQMGYREECDKCRARIPGHYSHFLPA